MPAPRLAVLALLAPSAALAQEAVVGDPAAGAEHFDRQCMSCHVVQDAAGEVLAGRAARTGPNLHGVIGRAVGAVEGFDYSTLMQAYAATGAVWGEENLAAYVQDPTGFLREATGEDGRSKMAHQVRDEQQAYDLYAFLAAFSPEDSGDAAASGDEVPSE